MDHALNACGLCFRGADLDDNGLEEEDEDQFWIQCDVCDQWYHGTCVDIQEYASFLLAKYHCPSCEEKNGKSVHRPHVNNSRYEFDDTEWENKPVQIGTKDFIDKFKRELLCKIENATSAEIERVASGSEVTVEKLIKSAWPKPYLVEKFEGLCMSIPQNITVEKILEILGPSIIVDTIDVFRQRSYKMSLGEFYKKWSQPKNERNRLYNVISLEFSNTKLAELVRLPVAVREISWAHHIWPCPHNPVEELGLRKWNLDKTELLVDHATLKPEVSMFCLIGMQDSFTDFHIDFGGSSVWYHVIQGEKVFIVAEPSDKNLKIFENWFVNPKRSEIYLADLLPEGALKLVRVKQGNTFLIPSGWIHAVWTPVDSLVFGGNFLSYLHVPLQLRIHNMEAHTKVEERYMFPSFEVVNWYAAKHLVELLRESNEDVHAVDPYLYIAAEQLIKALNVWIKRDKSDKTKKHIVTNYQKTVKDLEKVWRLQQKIKNNKVKKPSVSKLKKKKIPIVKCKALPPPVPPLRIATSGSQIPELAVRKPDLEVRKPDLEVQKPDLEVQKPDFEVQKPDFESGTTDSEPLVVYKRKAKIGGLVSPPKKRRKTPKLRLKISAKDSTPAVVPNTSDSNSNSAVNTSAEIIAPVVEQEQNSILDQQPTPITLQISLQKEEGFISDKESPDEKKSVPMWGFSMLDLRKPAAEEKRHVSPIRIARTIQEVVNTAVTSNSSSKMEQFKEEERAPSPDFSNMFGVSSHGRVQKPNALLCGNDDSYVYTPKVEVGHEARDKRKYATYKQTTPVKASDFPQAPLVIDELELKIEKPGKHSIAAVKPVLKSVKNEGSRNGGLRKGQATPKQRLASKLGIRKYALK